MITDKDLKLSKKRLAYLILIPTIALGINHFTGALTTIHLDNEEMIALEHGVDSPQFQSLIGELVEDSRSPLSWKRKLAAIELGKLGSNASIPTLRILLTDNDPKVRTAAEKALEEIESSITRDVDTH